MTIALSVVIANARDTTLDETATYRVSDAKYIKYANDFTAEAALLRPDLFATVGEINCTSGETRHSAPTTSIRLIDIFRVKNGQAVIETKREILDRYSPTWHSDTAAAAKNWMRHDRNPNVFFTYPKAPADQILIGEWAALPTAYAATSDNLTIQDVYAPAMHHYLVARAESRDDENVSGDRAKMFYALFVSLMGASERAEDKADAKEKANG